MKTLLVSLAIIMSLFGFAGGGGSSSGGGSSGGGGSYGGSSSFDSDGSSGDGNPIGALVVFGVFMIVIVFLVVSDKKTPTSKKPSRAYTEAEQKLIDEAELIFVQYQDNWSNGDTVSMKKYMTPSYYQRAVLMMQALSNLHRQNRVSELRVRSAVLINELDSTKKTQELEITFYFDGLDEVIDKETGKKLYSQKAYNINETWMFKYDGKKLLLDAIAQPTESAPHLVLELDKFAKENNLFYSPDWGRYALPSRGLIFNRDSMHNSDINNHIIGQWKDVLIQMYTYAQIPGVPSSYYIVGQLTVPKKYSGIIVKRRDYKKKIPREYQKYETEWQDFNKKYEVWATDIDKVTSFELLNPKFMAFLYDNDRDYNIEVVDDTIYIFAPAKKVLEQDYKTLLDILLEAYHELKM